MHKLKIIIVLYNCNYNKSNTLISLILHKDLLADLFLTDVFIQDNSDKQQKIPDSVIKSLKATYFHAPSNPGLSNAYNNYNNIVDFKKDWLLILDQDTTLNKKYFIELSKALSNQTNYVALVPFINGQNNKIVSPNLVSRLGTFKPINKNFSGVIERRATAFNSCTLINMEFLSQINGFTDKFPLDMLDHWFFSQVYKSRKKVCVLPVTVNHELSLLSKEYMKISRYKKFLKSEILYYRDEGKLVFFIYKLRLSMRTIKRFFKGHIIISKLTLFNIFKN